MVERAVEGDGLGRGLRGLFVGRLVRSVCALAVGSGLAKVGSADEADTAVRPSY